MIFLDTNVVSEAMRLAPEPQVLHWLAGLGPEGALSTIVIAELSFGIERIRPSERAPRLAKSMAALVREFSERVHGFDLESALIFGDIMGKAARAGRQIQVSDGMIGAIALRHHAKLATRNERDFEVLGLDVLNPWG